MFTKLSDKDQSSSGIELMALRFVANPLLYVVR